MYRKAFAMVPATEMSRCDRLERRRHTIAVCVAVATLTATLGGWTPSTAAAWIIAIVAIAVGLPHGALDIVIGPRLANPMLFIGLYLAAMLGIVLVWLASPAFGVVAFFASSWYHFARGDAVHPLVSLAIHFALWHAPRHLITLDIDRTASWRAVSATIGTLLGGVIAWRLVGPVAPSAARVVFIGLAALTGPHFVITELEMFRKTSHFITDKGILIS